jgi:hypothetical protein
MVIPIFLSCLKRRIYPERPAGGNSRKFSDYTGGPTISMNLSYILLDQDFNGIKLFIIIFENYRR